MAHRPSFEYALAAAARVSCCATLVSLGCHPSTTGSPTEVEGGEPGEAGAQPMIAEPDPYANDPALDPSTREQPVSEARAAFEQCQAQVSAANAEGTIGPSEQACCTSLAQHLYEPVDPGFTEDAEHTMQRRTADNDVWWNVSAACCSLIGNSEPACTPWGPPTPPSELARGPGAIEVLDLRSLARAERPAGLELERIDPGLRAAAIATWRARMINEHGSAPVFEGLLAQLEALVEAGTLDAATIERARAFASQERRHGVLCGAVVESLGGAALAPGLPHREFPVHADAANRIEACLRNVLSICCLSETVAVALIAAERHDMPEGSLRSLLTGIWADECGHANFGWRLLPKLLAHADADTRAGLAEYLRLAFAELERHELEHLPASFVPPRGGEVYGLCEGAQARALFYATLERVIIPGLEAQGLPARAAWSARTRHPSRKSRSGRVDADPSIESSALA